MALFCLALLAHDLLWPGCFHKRTPRRHREPIVQSCTTRNVLANFGAVDSSVDCSLAGDAHGNISAYLTGYPDGIPAENEARSHIEAYQQPDLYSFGKLANDAGGHHCDCSI